MEEEQKDHIRANLPDLAATTFPNTMLFAYLQSKRVLSPEDIAVLECESSQRSRIAAVAKFYEIMITKANSYQPLLEALARTRQTGALLILEQLGKQPKEEEEEPQEGEDEEPQEGEEPGQNVEEPGEQPWLGLEKIPDQELERFLVAEPEKDAVKINKRKVYPSLRQDYYNLPTGFKGYALILNIIRYTGKKPYRNGAMQDSKKMRNLLTQLGYKVFLFDNKEKEYTDVEIRQIVHSFKEYVTEEEKRPVPPSVIVFIGGHGDQGHIKASNHSTYVAIYDHVVYEFSKNKCPQLNDKPKVFIFQCCRGVQVEANFGGKYGDFQEIDHAVVCYATPPQSQSARSPKEGSYYISALVDVIEDNPNNLHFMEILSATRDVLKSKKIRLDNGAYYTQRSMHDEHELKGLYFNLELGPADTQKQRLNNL